MTTNNNINNFLNSKPGDTISKSGHNSSQDVRSLLLTMVSSLEVIDEEKENMKQAIADLKEQHLIKPEIARAVAKILHNPDLLKKAEDKNFEIEELYKAVTK